MDTNTERIVKTSTSITPWPRKLYNSAEELWQDSKGLHHWYIVWRTLDGKNPPYKGFKPDSVFYVDKSPAAYLKNVEKIDEGDIRKWQRFLWNQAVVPMLVVKSKTQIRVYTAYARPSKNDSNENIEYLLQTTADTLELERLWTDIEAGTIYETKPELFNRSKTVDRFLLENLKATAEKLAKTQSGGIKNKKNLEFVHQFLTRLLFVCYIIERGMISGKHFEDESLRKLKPANDKFPGYFLNHLFNDLNTYSQKKEALCRIFAQVKEHFNGSLFPEAIKEEKEKYNSYFIDEISNFLNCHSTKDGQYTFDFWAYDFRIIPIETISAIYENFIRDEGDLDETQDKKNSQRTAGAYYTPLHLAELTVDIALEGIKDGKPIHEFKILDPACGSGVFLVSLFGRMAEGLRVAEGYVENKRSMDWARKVSSLLQQLYGVDIKKTACHITCFSLYLALLEQLEPMDIEYLRNHNENKKAFQPLLAENKEGYHTIYQGNLFNPNLSFKEKDFDIVIGNPPWVSGKYQKDICFLNWQKNNPNILGPNKQIAHGFMWKASEYLLDSGMACLLLPTGVLLNDRTNQFQQEWFKSVTVERIVNFSDLRYVLFETAIHPCVAIRFKPVKSNSENMICYESPKTDIRSQKGGSVYIREEDTVYVAVKDIIHTAEKSIAPAFWKSHYWGSWRDRRLLSRLDSLPKLVDIFGKDNFGRGGEPYGENDIEKKAKSYSPWWDNSLQFIDSGDHINIAVVPGDFVPMPLEFKKLRRSPDKRLFNNPKILISRGTTDIKIAFCEKPVYFRDSIQSLFMSKDKNNIKLLRFLSIVMKSDLIRYYLFNTSSGWGIERDISYVHELQNLPFFLPENAIDSDKAHAIVNEVAKKVEEFEKQIEKEKWFGEEQKRKDRADKIHKELERLIRKYYDIDKYEAMLIDDTLDLAVRSFHPQKNTAKAEISTLVNVNDKQAKEYAETLCEMLNNFGSGGSFKVNGKIIKGQPYSVVRISLTEKIVRDVPILTANDELEKILKRMKILLQNKQGRFVFCKNMKVFDGNDLYILKPMQMRFWSRASALNDADEIAGAILNSREKNK